MSFKKIDVKAPVVKEVKLPPKHRSGYIKSINPAMHVVECPSCNVVVCAYSDREFFDGMLWTFCDPCNLRINL